MTFLKLVPAMSTHRGMRRKLNEDSIGYKYPDNPDLLARYGALFLVADGVGGLSAGDKASSMTVEQLTRRYYDDQSATTVEARLAQAVQYVNQHIYRALNKQAATTLVAVVIQGTDLIAASVGDSQIFHIRGENIEQLNEEDVLHEAGKDDGALTKAIGYREALDVQLITGKVSPGDKLILCSDGLTRYLNEAQLLKLATLRDPRDGVRRMINEANTAGGADNISAILIHIGDEVATEGITDHIARLVVPVSIDSQPMMTPDVPSKPQTQIPLARPEVVVPDTPITPIPRANPTPAKALPTVPTPPPPQPASNSQMPLLLGVGAVVLILGVIVVFLALNMANSTPPSPTPSPTTEVSATPEQSATATSAPATEQLQAVTEESTPEWIANAPIQAGDRIRLDDSVLTMVRVGDEVGAFVADADTIYQVDDITEFEGQLWVHLVQADSNQSGWVAQSALPTYQLQRNS